MTNENLAPVLISGVSCYERGGTAYLKLEDVARGLGFTDVKNGIEYVRWPRVDKYLADLGFATCGERPDYIPENIFYRLAMKAKNETAEKFQALVHKPMHIRRGVPSFGGDPEHHGIFHLHTA